MSDTETTEDKLPLKLPSAAAEAAQQAREQARAYESMIAPRPLTLKNGERPVEVPPHPNLRSMWDDDRIADYDQLEFEIKSYDREPDIFIPEQRIQTSDGNEIVLPSSTRPGPVIEPHQKTGEDGVPQLITPPYSVRVVIAALGEDEYKRLRKGGRSAGDVWRIWNNQGLDLSVRQAEDSKSNDGSLDLEPVPAPDSQ